MPRICFLSEVLCIFSTLAGCSEIPPLVPLSHDPPQFCIVITSLHRTPLRTLVVFPFLPPLYICQQRLLERASIIVQPIRHSMPSHTLLVPADLSAIGFAVLLRVEFGGANRGARVDEEETGHG
jgi:hypothetical protein